MQSFAGPARCRALVPRFRPRLEPPLRPQLTTQVTPQVATVLTHIHTHTHFPGRPSLWNTSSSTTTTRQMPGRSNDRTALNGDGRPGGGCCGRRKARGARESSVAAGALPLAPSPTVAEGEAEWAVPVVREGKRVVLVRHGESTWNATGRIQGSSNFSELTAKGEDQAETSRQMLAQDTFDVCFHSPLQRSAKTAMIIWGKRDAPMHPLDDLREIDLYSFQGLFKEQGKERYGAQYRMWQTDAANFEIDGHYPVRELWARARLCWDEMLASPSKSILVVAHNAVNQALVATSIGLGPEYFRTLLQSNCGVSVLDFTPDLASGAGSPSTLVSLNRLNQTPAPPVGTGQSAGRKAKCRIIFVCHGMTNSISQKRFPDSEIEKLNMLGLVQSRKTSELLLDVKVDTIFSSPCLASMATASSICEVQEAADCLGADCIPRYVDVVALDSLRSFEYGEMRGQERPTNASQLRDVLSTDCGESLESLNQRAEAAWADIRGHFDKAEAAWAAARARAEERAKRAAESNAGNTGNGSAAQNEGGDGLGYGDDEILPSETVVAVTDCIMIKALVSSCLGIAPSRALTFTIDEGGISVVDLPDGSQGKAVVRCLNYTAHLGRWAVPVTSPSFDDESF